jgi:hypothetical protein
LRVPACLASFPMAFCLALSLIVVHERASERARARERERGRDDGASPGPPARSPTSHLPTPKHTVLEGMDIVKKIEEVGSGSGTPSKTVVIVDSGELAKDA